MKNGTTTGAIFVVLILLVILCMVLFLTDAPSGEEQSPDEERPGASLQESTPPPDNESVKQPEVGQGDAEENESEQDSEENSEETSGSDREEAESAPPEQPVEPESAPDQTPQFTSRSLGTGSFRSATGVDLNLVISWSAKTVTESTVELSVQVLVESYTLYANASPGALILYAYGQPTVLNMPDLSIDSPSSLTQTAVASKTYTVNLSDGASAAVPISAEWLFGGVYSGADLPVIECGGDINLVR